MAKEKRRLGEILIDAGVLSEEALSRALAIQNKQGKRLGEVLVTEGFVSEMQIIEAVKKQLGIQLIDLNRITVRQEIINIVPDNIARKYEVLPVDVINGQLLLVMSDPLNYFAIEDIKIATGYVVKAAIALRSDILNNIERYYGKSKAEEAVQDFNRTYGFGKEEEEEVEDEAAAPVIKFLNTIIENAMLNHASDIHLEPDDNELRVRFRVDGVLREIMRTSIGMAEPVISRIKIMSDLNIAEKRIPQDGRINFKAKSRNIDIRVSTAPTIYGEKVVMRLLDKSNFSLELNNIGLESEDIPKLKNIISKPYGIILVCGPTGSGKTTTLYTILNVLNSVEKNIITIEDPVEYNFKGINQMQVNSKIGFDFASGLRSILRQDPDIIMVGEIRDNETAEISVRSALTGHLVLSTIHTNNAVGTITRFIDMGIEPFLLSSTITGIVAQRLVRKVCPSCVEEYVSSEREMKLLGVNSPVILKKGKGCPNCNGSGYKGRTAIIELLEVDSEIKSLIDTNASESIIEAAAVRKGMKLLRTSCISKVLQGVTTIDEMIRVTYGY